ELLSCCLLAEESVAGRHADNLAPALLGGLVLVRSLDPIDAISLPVPPELRIVVAYPNQRMSTRSAREVVPQNFPRDTLVYQAAQVGALVAALATGNYELLSRSLEDRVAEPYRAS